MKPEDLCKTTYRIKANIEIQSPDQYGTNESTRTDRVTCQIVDHARLISTIRNSSSQEIMFHYNNLCYWKELVSASDVKTRMSPKCVQQLSCRAMSQILKSKGSTLIGQSMIVSPRTIESDFIRNCQEYIEDEYQRSEHGELMGTFVDAYDIFAVGVVAICLTRTTSCSISVPDLVHKCTITLSILVERFPALRVFRRVLWALSSAALQNGAHDQILYEMPEVIPEGIQKLIKDFLS